MSIKQRIEAELKELEGRHQKVTGRMAKNRTAKQKLDISLRKDNGDASELANEIAALRAALKELPDKAA